MSVGPVEIIIVLALALLVFGPNRLPEMGRTIGRGLREFRKATDEVTGSLHLGLGGDDAPTPAPDARPAPAAAVTAAAAQPWPEAAATAPQTAATGDAPAVAASAYADFLRGPAADEPQADGEELQTPVGSAGAD